MSKLLSLKRWLTLGEAAQHLSGVFQEAVDESTVLRLGLDGYLTLSVNLVNGADVRLGRVVPLEEAEMGEFPADACEGLPGLPDALKGKPVPYIAAIHIAEDEYLNLADEVTTAWGIWDIPLLGGDRLDIEHMYQMLTGGPEITASNLEGAFLRKPEDPLVITQLQESYEDNEFMAGSRASLTRIRRRISEGELDRTQGSALLAKHEKYRRKFLERRRTGPRSENYYPAGGLPKDAPLVIRTGAILELQQRVFTAAPPDRSAVPDQLGSRERTTLLTLLGLLAHVADLDLDELPKLVLAAADEKGISVSRRTIEEKFKAVRAAMTERTK